ncbi:MAG: carboxypeptidase-like regulatory domain-containing protein, partial [Pyrinomonadaceae bacterium]
MTAAGALSLNSTLNGTVVDEQDAVLPDATVLVADVNGGLKRQVKTDRDGSFTVQLRAPGSYTVSVQHRGFIPAEIKDVILRVNDHVVLK